MRKNPTMSMNIEVINHIVLTVKDIDASCAFYAQVLGMRVTTFGGGRKALSFGTQKINLHQEESADSMFVLSNLALAAYS
jgi:catechol 2,3-dioxygenase-like lactoylglutathione lyase family enzyme